MKKITLAISAELATLIGITASMDENAIGTAVAAALKKVERLPQVEGQLNTAKLELEALKKTTITTSVAAQLDEAQNAKKITAEFKAVLAEQYAEKPEDLKKVLAALPSFISVTTRLIDNDNKGNYTPEVQALMDKGWDKLHKEGGLDKLQALSEDAFVELYEGKYGYKPNEKPAPSAPMKKVKRTK